MNGNWLKNFGGAPQTRMQAAHEAIKAIVTDASLTSGVNFGFAYWAHGSSGFNNWQMVWYLVSNGAEINAKNEWGGNTSIQSYST